MSKTFSNESYASPTTSDNSLNSNNDIALAWKSKTFSNESYASPTTSDNSLNSRLDYFNNSKFWSEFDGSCLKLDKITFTLIKIIHLHITYEIMAILWWQ